MLIVGNGGMKSTKTYEEDESLNGYVITLQRLDKLLGQAMKSGKVTIEETTITGIDKTEFELLARQRNFSTSVSLPHRRTLSSVWNGRSRLPTR